MTESGSSVGLSNEIIVEANIPSRRSQSSTPVLCPNVTHAETVPDRNRSKDNKDLANSAPVINNASQFHRKRRKTGAECSREYRAKKAKILAEDNDNKNQNAAIKNDVHRKRKSAAQRSREYRARKKAKIQSLFDDIANLSDTVAKKNGHRKRKSAAQRAREYRARKKAKVLAAFKDVGNLSDSVESGNLSEYQNRILVKNDVHRRRKTAAERSREYRARKKAKIQSADNGGGNSQDPIESGNSKEIQYDMMVQLLEIEMS